ncbi:MAG: hypothetical protein ISR69_08615 [Gammaproteobacteria bacterium]|nr:hypothetical protein [Gammaproteobacteria bacterium]
MTLLTKETMKNFILTIFASCLPLVAIGDSYYGPFYRAAKTISVFESGNLVTRSQPEELTTFDGDQVITQTVFKDGSKKVEIDKIIRQPDYFIITKSIRKTECINTHKKPAENDREILPIKYFIRNLNDQISLEVDVSGFLDKPPWIELKDEVDEHGIYKISYGIIPSQKIIDRINSQPEGC